MQNISFLLFSVFILLQRTAVYQQQSSHKVSLQMHPVAYSSPSKSLMMLSRRTGTNTNSHPLVRLSRCMSRQAASSSSRTRLSSSSSSQEKTNLQKLHSSAKSEHSSIPLQDGVSTQASKNVQAPARKQLRILFAASAIPMVGFGFMDNLVMIQGVFR